MGSINSTLQYSPYISSLLDPAPATSTQSSSQSTSSAATSSASGSASTNAALVSSLLSGGSFAPEVLSVLQGPDAAGNFNPTSELLGGGSPTNSNSLASELDNLYSSSAEAAIAQAKAQAGTSSASSGNGSASSTQTVTGSSLINSLINASIQNSVSQDNALVQNAQTILSNNSQS